MSDVLAAFCLSAPAVIKLDDFDPGTSPVSSGSKAKNLSELETLVAQIGVLQNTLYAERRQKLLVVLQGMDTSGKDGTIRSVFAKTHPLGLNAVAYKAPTVEELARDYLWRVHADVPAKGQIAVFNRSHYEDVIAARVLGIADAAECERRFRQIIAFERLLTETGTRVVKCMLHISKDEQKKRLEERLVNPEKFWKFDPADLIERGRWAANQDAYERAIGATACAAAPWWIVPSDSKTQRDLMVARIVRDALVAMAPKFPPLPAQFKKLKVD